MLPSASVAGRTYPDGDTTLLLATKADQLLRKVNDLRR
jgi:hypothetical protein